MVLPMETHLLSVPQLAAALGVDRTTIHRRIERGALEPAGYVGNRAVFRREDVEALVRGEQTLPKEPAAEELPEVGTLWRFQSSMTRYKVTEVRKAPNGTTTFVSLRTLDTGANTTLDLDDFRARCVFLGRLGARS